MITEKAEKKDRPVIVTGASGLVGSNLTAALLRDHYTDVTLIVRNAKSKEKLFRNLHALGAEIPENSFTLLEGDIDDFDFLCDAFRGKEVIFNCAGKISLDASGEDDVIRTNVMLAEIAVKAALETNPQAFVHVSSIAALGHAPYPEQITEKTAFQSLYAKSAYSISKFYSENEVWKAIERGLKAVIVNPAVILGTGEQATGSSAFVKLVDRGFPVYTGGVMGCVDVKDVARAMILLSRTPQAVAQRFILSAANLSYKELFAAMASAMGKAAPFILIPKGGLRFLSFLDRCRAVLTNKKPALTEEIVCWAYSKSCYNGDKIKDYIDFEYTDIHTTVEEMCRNFRLGR